MEEQLVCKICGKSQTQRMKAEGKWSGDLCDTCSNLDESERKELYEINHPDTEYPGEEKLSEQKPKTKKVKKPVKEMGTTTE